MDRRSLDGNDTATIGALVYGIGGSPVDRSKRFHDLVANKLADLQIFLDDEFLRFAVGERILDLDSLLSKVEFHEVGGILSFSTRDGAIHGSSCPSGPFSNNTQQQDVLALTKQSIAASWHEDHKKHQATECTVTQEVDCENCEESQRFANTEVEAATPQASHWRDKPHKLHEDVVIEKFRALSHERSDPAHQGGIVGNKVLSHERRSCATGGRSDFQSYNQTARSSLLLKFVKSFAFKVIVTLLIGSNAIFIGAQVNLDGKREFSRLIHGHSWEENHFWTYIEYVYLAAFSMELLLRLVAEQGDFLLGMEYKWNMFDALVIMSNILEVVFLRGLGSKLHIVGLMRLFRIVRIFKVLYMIPLLKEFHKMVISVLDSIPVLFPAICLFIIVAFIFSCAFLQGVLQHLQEVDAEHPSISELQKIFGIEQPLLNMMLALYMAVTSGRSWIEIYKPLRHAGTFYEMVFLIYVAFAFFVILNVVTGIFVDVVHDLHTPLREEIVEHEMAKRRQYAQDLAQVFVQGDVDHSGLLSLAEFSAGVENPSVHVYLEYLGLDFQRASELFSVLDSNRDGSVSIDEFVAGCLAMRGEAKSLDLWNLKAQVNTLNKSVRRLVACLQGSSLMVTNVSNAPSAGREDSCLTACL